MGPAGPVMFATIDIGTNSVLLLIGRVLPDGRVEVIEDRAEVTRLGEGLSSGGIISDAASERTLNTVASYYELCVKHGVKSIAIVGTAPFRVAKNVGDFRLVLKRTTGLDVEVISAEREARLTYNSQAHDFGADIIVVDIGGGSTELATTVKGNMEFVSLPVGCVSLTESFFKNDPASSDEIHKLRQHIGKILESVSPPIFSRPHDRNLIATAGTATTLMSMHLRLPRYDPALVHGQSLKVDALRNIIEELRSKTSAEKKHISGLAPERSDVILAGAELLHEIMGTLGYSSVTISDRGIKWGLFYEKFGGL